MVKTDIPETLRRIIVTYRRTATPNRPKRFVYDEYRKQKKEVEFHSVTQQPKNNRPQAQVC